MSFLQPTACSQACILCYLPQIPFSSCMNPLPQGIKWQPTFSFLLSMHSEIIWVWPSQFESGSSFLTRDRLINKKRLSWSSVSVFIVLFQGILHKCVTLYKGTVWINSVHFSTRVGYIVYSDSPNDEFFMNQVFSEQDMRNRILQASYDGRFNTISSQAIAQAHFGYVLFK